MLKRFKKPSHVNLHHHKHEKKPVNLHHHNSHKAHDGDKRAKKDTKDKDNFFTTSKTRQLNKFGEASKDMQFECKENCEDGDKILPVMSIDPRDRNYVNAVVRFEDKLKPEMAFQRQQISHIKIPLYNGKDFHRVYSFRSGDFHAVLENERGSEVLDFKDINFERKKSYIALRMGLGLHLDYATNDYYSLTNDITKKNVETEKGRVKYKSIHDLEFPQQLIIFEVSPPQSLIPKIDAGYHNSNTFSFWRTVLTVIGSVCMAIFASLCAAYILRWLDPKFGRPSDFKRSGSIVGANIVPSQGTSSRSTTVAETGEIAGDGYELGDAASGVVVSGYAASKDVYTSPQGRVHISQ